MCHTLSYTHLCPLSVGIIPSSPILASLQILMSTVPWNPWIQDEWRLPRTAPDGFCLNSLMTVSPPLDWKLLEGKKQACFCSPSSSNTQHDARHTEGTQIFVEPRIMGLGFIEGRRIALQSGFIGDKLQHRGLADGNIFLLRKIFKWVKNNLPKLAYESKSKRWVFRPTEEMHTMGTFTSRLCGDVGRFRPHHSHMLGRIRVGEILPSPELIEGLNLGRWQCNAGSAQLLRAKCWDTTVMYLVSLSLPFLLTLRGCLCAVNGSLERPSWLHNGASGVWLFLHVQVCLARSVHLGEINRTSVTANSTQLVWDKCPELAPPSFFMATLPPSPQGRAVDLQSHLRSVRWGTPGPPRLLIPAGEAGVLTPRPK